MSEDLSTKEKLDVILTIVFWIVLVFSLISFMGYLIDNDPHY